MTAAMTSLRTIALGALILAAASATPGAARADDTLATLARPAPVSAYGGRIAWSSYDAAQQNYALMTRVNGVNSVVPVARRTVPFDVDLGPDQNGDTVAVYSRCSREPGPRKPVTGNIIANQMPNWSSGRGCNLYRFNFATGRETTVAAANSPGASEFLPTIWKTRVAFARVYERKQGIGGDRAYLYFRGVEGAGKSVQVPAGSRSTQRFCSGKPRRCKRLVEPGPTALDLAGRRLAFGWDSGASDPTTAAYYATLRAHSKKHRVEFGSSGSIQAEEVLSPVVDSGMVYWGLGLFGDTTASYLRRYRITTGARQQTPLPSPSIPDAFVRPVPRQRPSTARRSTTCSPASGCRGEPCTVQSPCIADPGCTDAEPCRLNVVQNPPFATAPRQSR